jgi:hypothetical protein
MKDKFIITIKDFSSNAKEVMEIDDSDTILYVKNKILQKLAEVIIKKHQIEPPHEN